ncbi:MAG TPA: leucine--tRNA ligase [Candidatus Saccharimonadales bacterium]|nr:leucine--tRNA ligase [Candidatus Saccharimonadales bacterium]
MKRYNPSQIEPKWQKVWAETGIYNAQDDNKKPKNYILDFFPYPSGAAMHVGHVRNYTISDALARFARQRGQNVLHPMGWDEFGLPAENYAIKTGVSPQVSVKQNTSNFKKQLTQMGIGIDWTREFGSSDPDYYRWTQWLFTVLFERGLAYKKESLQWWCETDKTVLANEQVEAGRCWRCGNKVTKKPLEQWFFKITDYADRLADDLEDLDWSDAIKAMQRNWIGRSRGAEVDFDVVGSKHKVKIFTTRPDTLFGATFLVLAPEHPLVTELTTAEHKENVDQYIAAAMAKSDVDRMETDREKTGVQTGSYAVNPVNGEQIPIWVADYALMGYGTGAVMACPAHDERDFAFAQKFNLPIIEVVEPITGKPQENPEFRRSIVAIVRDPKTKKYLSINWGKNGGNLFVGGGREENEDIEATALREITEETGYKNVKLVSKTGRIHHHYFAHSKNVARQIEAHAMLFDLVDDEQTKTALEENEKGKFTVEWLSENEIVARIQDELHATAYQLLTQNACYHGEGVMVNSGKYDGMSSSEARDKIVADLHEKKAGSERVNYKIRDWLISRQRYWGAPIPIIHCEKDGLVPVPVDQLPVELPPMESYEPSGDGRSPLARVPEWVNTTCPTCGGPATRETDTMDGFACSSWYFLRFADPHNNKVAFDADKIKYWLPVDTYIGGAEHAVMHLLYARFWTKVMHDAGMIDFDEPFTALRNHGMIWAPDGRKMSKSFGNTIAPDDLIADGYGADAIRVMELFIAPWNQGANWSTEGLGGCYRFLTRAWTVSQEYLHGKEAPSDRELETRLTIATHKTIKKVTEDLNTLGFNTAIAALMEYVNELYKIKVELPPHKGNAAWTEAISALAQLLAPFAPHIAEELWSDMGRTDSVHVDHWPTWDEKFLVADVVTIVIQVNGKVRAKFDVPAEITEEEVTKLALENERVIEFIGVNKPKKVIYIPGRLVNIVA